MATSPHAPQDEESVEIQPCDDFAFAVDAALINPFDGKTHEEMEILIQIFIERTSIDSDWYPYIRKGAYLAQDRKAFNKARNDGLSLRPQEKAALKAEDPEFGNKWDQPFILYALVACCSMGAAVQGWDETAINQAQIQDNYTSDLGITAPDQPVLTDLWRGWSHKFGVINSAPYLCCAILGCWLTEPLNRYLGRRGAIFVSCLISSATCVWQAFASNWRVMFAARFCLGLGIGPKSATVPIYAAECAPANIRGALVTMWQMWTAFGLMLGYISGVALQGVSDKSRWKLIIGSPMILPLVVCAYVFTLPESPRWLLWKAHQGAPENKYYTKSFNSLCRLRTTRLQAARDMFLIYHQLLKEHEIVRHHNRFIELWTVARNRRAFIASVVCMFFQQFCGVNVLAYYSSLIFSEAKVAHPTTASTGFGIINFVFAFPAVWSIDSFGRRNLLLVTFPFMALFQFLTGIAFLFKDPLTTRVLLMVGMYLFSVSYSPGMGPVPFVYSAESMPLYVRDIGMSVVTAINWLLNFVLAITFPYMRNTLNEAGAFGFYAACCILGWVAILLLVPETKNQTLEELDARFSISTKAHARYGFQQCKYFIRFHILRQKPICKPRLNLKLERGESSIVEKRRNEPRKISFDNSMERLVEVASNRTGITADHNSNRGSSNNNANADLQMTISHVNQSAGGGRGGSEL